MDAFATEYDYTLRYGAADGCADLATLLSDATAFIASQHGFARNPDNEAQSANLVRITCAVVHRSLSAGSLAGIQSYSEGAVGYTASVTPYNPSGDFYLTKAERRSLGISGGRVGMTDPYGCGGADG